MRGTGEEVTRTPAGARAFSELHQFLPDCDPDEFGKRTDAELFHSGLAVMLCGSRADAQEVGDVPARLAVANH